MAEYLLGIDNGGTVAKAALFTPEGKEVAVAARKTEMISPEPGHTERDMNALWRATADAVRSVIDRAGAAGEEILGVATTGHGNGIYLIDERGQPVRNGIISTDTRAKEYVARWNGCGVADRVLPHTMQCLWPGQPNAILAWLRDHEPQSLARTRWVLMCKDYIRYRLSGEYFAELSDMSGTSLMSVRDADYSEEVLDAFGLADVRDLLPPVKRSEEVCGRVTARASAETGLAEGTPVAGGMFDIDACGLASGMIDGRALCIVAGTWSCNQFVSKTPVVDKDVFMTTRYCVPDYYLVLEASATSASNLEWFVANLLKGEAEAAEQDGKSIYEICNRLVGRTRAAPAGIIFLPFLFGSNADPDAKASLIGLCGWHGLGDVLRAIYEGVVFSHKAHIDRLLRFREPPETIRLTGGAARSEVWVQMFADLLALPVEIPAGTELGALGAAMCAGIAAGRFSGYAEAVEAMVRVARVHQPDPSKTGVYVEKYGRYRKVLDALGPVWKELA